MNEPATLNFDEIFASVGVLGHTFSERLAALDGQTVRMRGYLAPTGHGNTDILALTRIPVAPCSDCGSGHDLPADAVFVFPADGDRPGFVPGREIAVEGVLEHGSLALPEAEATSLVRLRDARWSSN
ncbi:MAG: hypothetical protein QM699_16200 [Amaricoccus sp.]|uniref:hypothetical protein n=1 Tax=Amaricoccus sp. TaxID=1872485 RepID=UPI0039E67926